MEAAKAQLKDWQVRQKHEEDVIAVHKSLGHLGDHWHFWRFNGHRFFEAMKKLGHDRSMLEDCRCWQEREKSGLKFAAGAMLALVVSVGFLAGCGHSDVVKDVPPEIALQATVESAYDVIVDYRETTETLVHDAAFDFVSATLTEANCPRPFSEPQALKVELIRLNRRASSEEALAEMSRLEYRPMTVHELIAFAAQHPNEQRKGPIVALGSRWRDSNGETRMVYLLGHASCRDIRFGWMDDRWTDKCRFAVVRKSPQ